MNVIGILSNILKKMFNRRYDVESNIDKNHYMTYALVHTHLFLIALMRVLILSIIYTKRTILPKYLKI